MRGRRAGGEQPANTVWNSHSLQSLSHPTHRHTPTHKHMHMHHHHLHHYHQHRHHPTRPAKLWDDHARVHTPKTRIKKTDILEQSAHSCIRFAPLDVNTHKQNKRSLQGKANPPHTNVKCQACGCGRGNTNKPSVCVPTGGVTQDTRAEKKKLSSKSPLTTLTTVASTKRLPAPATRRTQDFANEAQQQVEEGSGCAAMHPPKKLATKKKIHKTGALPVLGPAELDCSMPSNSLDVHKKKVGVEE